MTLSLSSGDIARFAALQEALLSPLEHGSVEDWCVQVLRCAEALFQGDRSAMLVPLDGDGIHYVSESIDPLFMTRFQERITQLEPGALRFSEDRTDQAWEYRRSTGLEVWSIPLLVRLLGASVKKSPVYQEIVLPAGITHGPVANTALPAGEAFLGVANSKSDEARFNDADGLALMRMLLPAFRAGVHTLLRLDGQRRTLLRTADELGQPFFMFDLNGREIHRSRQFEELLVNEPDEEGVIEIARRLAACFARTRTCRLTDSEVFSTPAASQELQTQSARYCVRASYVGRGILGLDDVVVVSLERLTPLLPSTEQLQERYGLTEREAEVALLMARGLSNRELAERLSLSPHTVRHHAESIFAKLGVRSRKALGLKLM